MMERDINNLEPVSDTNVTSNERPARSATLLFALVVIVATVDLLGDQDGGIALEHLLIEGGLITIGLAGLASTLATLRRTRREAATARADAAHAESDAAAARDRAADARAQADALAADLEATRAEADRWRTEAQELLSGLAEAIDQQFDRWTLSQSEREVALLLLKGLSHQEIATLRGVRPTTTRQQARAVYKKAGLEGRHDLAAFFLEDLLVPIERAEASVVAE